MMIRLLAISLLIAGACLESALADDKGNDQFILGKSFFEKPWVAAPASTTARDGLGPLFSANTCESCHPSKLSGGAVNESGLVLRSLIFKLSSLEPPKDRNQAFSPHPIYGGQLSINAVHGVPFEARPVVLYQYSKAALKDGEQIELRTPKYRFENMGYGKFRRIKIGPRRASSIINTGLIQDIPSKAIYAEEDPNDRDKDGISGKANRVWSVERNQISLGRYGWKAGAATLRQQIALAMVNDMGLTSSLYPKDNCTSSQKRCLAATHSDGGLDVTDDRLRAVTYFVAKTTRTSGYLKGVSPKGEIIFKKTGCMSCHKMSYSTRKNQQIYPFSDFLLHDMGEKLADEVSEFLADEREWRTAPLWGMGYSLKKNPKRVFLHDGRARTLTEAILWHGGEAEKARVAFESLAKVDRLHLLEFVKGL